MKVGEQVDIDLSLYFGEGIANAQFVSVVASDENSADLTIGNYADGKFSVKAAKVGTATITVTMLVGGGSLTDDKKPFPTEVVRKFAVISKESVASNGGWL